MKPEIIEHSNIMVVRDDKMPGGTKARVIAALFDHHHEYVYASPVQGYAQLALAYAAKAAGKRATVICAARKKRYFRTVQVMRAGAKVIGVKPGYLTVVQKRARDYCKETGAKLLPFGLDTAEIRAAIAAVAISLEIDPAEVWTVAGSGTLTRALQMAWPKAAFHAVAVGHEPQVGRAKLWRAPEKFEDSAKHPPPFPSCNNYDAKAWQFISRHAKPGALFWNVAA